MGKVDPYSTWPSAKKIIDQPGGNCDGYRVEVRFHSPERFKIAKVLSFVYPAISVFVFLIFMGNESAYLGIVGTFCIVSTVMMVLFLSREIVKRRLVFEFRSNTINISGFFGLKKREFEREKISGFELRDHEKAVEYEKRKKGKHFKNSKQILMHYARQPIRIASVYGKIKAEQFCRRLEYILEEMDPDKDY